MNAPLSEQQLAERCVCAATSVEDRTAAEHAVWCPSRKPTSERIAEVKAGSGRPLMDGELEWLRGDASRAELHISGSRAGAFPMTDDLPGFVVELAQKLGAVVAELDRTRTALTQSENDLTGARLSLWEEEQDTRALREERHSTNEVLDDAVAALKVKDERIADLEAERDKLIRWHAEDGKQLSLLERRIARSGGVR